MSKKKKTKGQKQFAFFLKIYVGVLALATIIICIVLWGKLKKYQNSYEAAKKAGNPDLFAEEFIGKLDYDTLLSYINEYGINEKDGININVSHADYFYDFVKKNGAKYVRSEKFNDALPIYDIYSADTRIAVISLKSQGKNDQFGFHKWTLKNMAFDTDNIKYTDIEIVTPEGATVSYNGQLLTENEIVRVGERKEPAAAKIRELGYTIPNTVSYKVCSTFGNMDIKVKDEAGNELTPVISGIKYDYSAAGETIPEELKNRVFEITDSYIYTMYSLKSFSETSRYIEYGSEAYSLITDVLNSVLWGWKPSKVDILEQDVTDYVRYGENVFACNYYGKIYKFKEGAMENGEETFKYRMVFRRLDGKWFLNYFVII